MVAGRRNLGIEIAEPSVDGQSAAAKPTDMNKILLPLMAALPVLLTACATPPPPPQQVYRSDEHPALVIESLDDQNSRLIQPDATDGASNDTTIARAKTLGKQPVAVVILENYSEARPGDEFRDRGVPWFVNLRGLGYEHIVFLHGNGVPNPDGLITLVKYD
jgi:starvation-inducible outer membrane lipoprotein